jgi:hypothetical protein
MASASQLSHPSPVQTSQLPSLQWLFHTGIVLICLISLGLSIIEGLCNFDFHHPGLMFSPAIDLKHGLKPFKEIVILYGYLTTYIQSLSLHLLGEHLLSIWISTGAFYAGSLYLSYRIFLIFLAPWLAFIPTALIFLIHPYVLYPWSNYYCYTFSLFGLLLFVPTLAADRSPPKRSSTISRRDALFSYLFGICLIAAILCRFSSAIGMITPLVIFSGFEWLTSAPALRQRLLQQVQFILLGAATLLSIFAVYCFSLDVWSDFLSQSATVSNNWRLIFLTMLGYREGPVTLFLIGILFQKIGQSFHQDPRLIVFSLNFFFMAGTIGGYVGLKSLSCWGGKRFADQRWQLHPTDRIIFLLSLLSIFAYTNSTHVYDTFRLVNGASIGFGVITYLLLVRLPQLLQFNPIVRRIHRSVLLAGLAYVASIFCHNLAPFDTISQWGSYWDSERILQGQGNQIPAPVFTHQLMSPIQEQYYQKILAILSQFDNSFVLINDTSNSLLSVISNKPRAYLMPAKISMEFRLSLGDSQRREQAIRSGKAILITYQGDDIPPGYREMIRLNTMGLPASHPSGTTFIIAKP